MNINLLLGSDDYTVINITNSPDYERFEGYTRHIPAGIKASDRERENQINRYNHGRD